MDENRLHYAVSHEWVDIQGTTGVVGITQFAVTQLTDIVYIELPAVGRKLAAGETFGVIESVKAVSDLYAPLAGAVTAVNTKLVDDPAILSADPYEKGWMIKLQLDPPVDASKLLTKAAYDAQAAH